MCHASQSTPTRLQYLCCSCRPYLQACLFDEGLQDSLSNVRQALKDSALASAFVRQAPAEMAVMEQIEDHPDRSAMLTGGSSPGGDNDLSVGWLASGLLGKGDRDERSCHICCCV